MQASSKPAKTHLPLSRALAATLAASLAATLAFTGTPAAALDAACNPNKAGTELTGEEAQAVYECIAADLDAGWKTGPKRWIPADRTETYRDWDLASRFPAAPGFHGERFLVTRVNATGHDAYTRYADDPSIPAGTLIAKESFTVTEAGEVKAGPLFFMEKVNTGSSPETMDWYYYAVAPSGTPMAVNVMTACNSCHVETFGFQGGMGYPVPEARLN
ncbi:MAG: hypothetical protein AAFS07_02215 [Pseudomonadota bacterium]